jgi:hypothetical protein
MDSLLSALVISQIIVYNIYYIDSKLYISYTN